MIQEEGHFKNTYHNYAKHNSNSPPIHQGNNVYTQQKTKISHHPTSSIISNKGQGSTNDQKVGKKSPNHGLDTAIGLYTRPLINKQEDKFFDKKKYKNTDNDINSQQAIPSSKNVPSFIQAKDTMKNSLCMGNQTLDSARFLKAEQSLQQDKNNIQNFLNKKSGKISQTSDARSNSTQYLLRNRYPAFLLQKVQKKQKKAPFQNQVERPQSSKQVLLKSNPSGSLINSYGSMKKSKIEPQKINQEIQQTKQESKLITWGKRIDKDKKLTMNDFDVIKQLGSGKYGKVFLVRQKKSNFLCALKIVQKKLLKEQQITQQFIRQLKIQSFLNHPNIIKMYGFFDDAVNIYIILEIGTGGQLFKQLKRHQSMPQVKVAGIIRQVCQAVLQLHSHQIIHRDIKPENIVLNQGVIKLCDFGWSVYTGQTLRTTFCGSPLYVGPQILKGKQYDQKIDIWSLGIMMYQMMVGENPFKITKESQLIKIVKDQIKIASYIQITDQGRSFLFDCLQKNPDERKSIRELLNHEFFKKYPEKSEKKVNF